MSTIRRLTVALGIAGLLAVVAAPPAGAQMSPEEAQRLLEQAERQRQAEPESDASESESGAAAADADAVREPIPFDELPPNVRLRFERATANYLFVGRTLWAIESWLRLQRFAPDAGPAEPYYTDDAPLFYDPVADRRVQSLDEVTADLSDPPDDPFVLLYGKLADRQPGVALIQTPRGIALVTDLPEDRRPDATGRLLLIGQHVGEAELRMGGETRPIPRVRYRADGPVRRPTARQLVAYFQQHEIDRFHRFQPRKVWDERPKARKVYETASSSGSSDRRGGGVGIGAAEPREVITDPGEYHWTWLPDGNPTPPLHRLTHPDSDESNEPDDSSPDPGS